MWVLSLLCSFPPLHHYWFDDMVTDSGIWFVTSIFVRFLPVHWWRKTTLQGKMFFSFGLTLLITSVLITFLPVATIFVRFLPIFLIIVVKQGIKHVLGFRVWWWCSDELKQCVLLWYKKEWILLLIQRCSISFFFWLYFVFPFTKCLIRLIFCFITKVELFEMMKGCWSIWRVKNVTIVNGD